MAMNKSHQFGGAKAMETATSTKPSTFAAPITKPHRDRHEHEERMKSVTVKPSLATSWVCDSCGATPCKIGSDHGYCAHEEKSLQVVG